ncbi:DUF2294 domain-containing protein [Baekduia soli]|nr:DUF2294 domain-containing protein [Baekduia soli]
MTDHEGPATPQRGSLSAAIATAMVQLVRDYTGRGPTKARVILRDSVVVVLLEDTLTKGEQSLVRTGQADTVLAYRHSFQEAMRDDATAMIERLTRRRVTAMMSANHVDPDLGAEIFMLDGAPEAPHPAGEGARGPGAGRSFGPN